LLARISASSTCLVSPCSPLAQASSEVGRLRHLALLWCDLGGRIVSLVQSLESHSGRTLGRVPYADSKTSLLEDRFTRRWNRCGAQRINNQAKCTAGLPFGWLYRASIWSPSVLLLVSGVLMDCFGGEVVQEGIVLCRVTQVVALPSFEKVWHLATFTELLE
jgi:hypothetical protein